MPDEVNQGGLMKKMNIIIGFVIFGLMMSCASQKKVEQDDDFATDATSADSKSTTDAALDSSAAPSTGTDESEFALNEPDANSKKSSPEDEFADFDKKDKTASGADASQATGENLSLDESKADNAAAQASSGTPGSTDEFAEFDKAAGAGSASAAGATHDPELSLEKELNSAEVTPESATPTPEKQAQSADPLQDVALNAPPPPPEVAANPVIPETVAPLTPDATASPSDANASSTSPLTSDVPVAASAETVSHESQNLAEIDSVQYKPNQSGGALSINANHPLQFSTRVNSATNQVIVEVQNAVIPNKLKRSLNTKDMASSIGSIDIYQKPNSKVARFVVQLRPGSPDPLVQPEGNSLLIIGASAPGSAQRPSMAHQDGGPHQSSSGEVAQQGMGSQQSMNGMGGAPVVMNESAQAQSHTGNGQEAGSSSQASVSAGDPIAATGGVLSSDSLEDFLINNNKFYGKKISIETNNLDVKEAIKFIAEESGANLLMDDGLEGKVSLRLRQVPWDQALVLILKAKKLGYVRQGNVLRIARLTDIQNEEAEAVKLLENRRSNEPLMVKRFLISYADIKELEGKIKEFIASTAAVVPGAAGPAVGSAMAGAAVASGAATSATLPPPAPRGKVISDIRTSSLIVTDTPDNIAKIEKLIAALDSQPRQVLIEGKVIEATEEFSRSIGVNWSSNPVKATTFNKAGLSITQALPTGGALDSSFTWGRVDVLGDLTARLMLGERQDKVRTLSSPKITVLSNQPANISQAVSVQIKAGSTTVANSAGSVTTDQINTVPLGVFLKVTPQASNEGTVTLDMDIEKSTLVAVDSTSTNKRNAKSKVIVKSGQTAVIGGIFEATNTTGVSGVPGLKDIPILGSLFRGQVEQNQKSELIIFVTPHILQPVVGDDKKSSSVLD